MAFHDFFYKEIRSLQKTNCCANYYCDHRAAFGMAGISARSGKVLLQHFYANGQPINGMPSVSTPKPRKTNFTKSNMDSRLLFCRYYSIKFITVRQPAPGQCTIPNDWLYSNRRIFLQPHISFPG